MRRCQACPADSEVDADLIATYDDPAAQKFNVCPKHATEALASGAVITLAPLTEGD